MTISVSEQLIKETSESIQARINRTNEELEALKEILAKVQDMCPHVRVEEYRDRRTGTCPVCHKKFSDKYQIDAIFSE